MPNAFHTALPAVFVLAAIGRTQAPADIFSVEHPRSAFELMPVLSAGLAVADLDGDGVPDAAFHGPTIQWGTGTGFELGPVLGGSPLAAQQFSSAPHAFDCDGDGDVDLLQPPGDLWINDGAGGFVAATTAGLAPFPLAGNEYAAIDLDGDGDVDFASDFGRIVVNDGAGNFTEETATRVSGAPTVFNTGPIVVADFDADGIDDVAYGGGLLRGAANGTFTFDGALGQLFRYGDVAFAVDADGDGDPDLVTGAGQLLRNDGSGVFAAETFAHDGVRSVGDIDGDGIDDLLVLGSSYPYAVGWVRGTGSGFGALQPFLVPGSVADPDPFWWRARLVDLDDDGDLDVAIQIDSITRHVPPVALLNDGAGALRAADELSGETIPVSRTRELFDVDGDGAIDVVTAGRVFVNDGAGGLAVRSTLPTGTFAWVLYGSGDFDGDGDEDLLVGQPMGSTLEILANDGAGAFASGAFSAMATGSRPASVAVDWDGDGDTDLVTANTEITFWENQGGGALVAHTLAMLPTRATGLAAADLDADTRVDLAVTQADPIVGGLYHFGPWFQEAGGALTAGRLLVVNRGTSVAIEDLDGDRDGDLVAYGAGGQTKVLENLGGRTFSAPSWTLPNGNLEFGDLDLDGRTDLAIGGRWPEVYLATTAAGAFAPMGSFDALGVPARTSTWALDLVDLDRDGDLDMIHSGRGSGSSNPEGLFFYWNVHARCRVGAMASVGGRLDVEVRSALGPNAAGLWALPWAGFAPASTVIPGVGAIGIDLSSAVGLPWQPFAGGDEIVSTASIPTSASFVGIELFVQCALVGTPSGEVVLTNVARGTIGG